jgi:hypothetical protein
MSNERDPVLETLFAESKLEINENGFSDQVMDGVEKRRRNVFLGRIALLALLVAFELLLSEPVTHSVGAMTELLSSSLFDIKTDWLAIILSPLNSVAGLIGVLLVGLLSLYRKFVR